MSYIRPRIPPRTKRRLSEKAVPNLFPVTAFIIFYYYNTKIIFRQVFFLIFLIFCDFYWYSLNSLQKGKALSFLYHDSMYYNNDEVKVLVNPIGFKKVYSEYQNCMNNLFDFGFDDIKYISLDFVKKVCYNSVN